MPKNLPPDALANLGPGAAGGLAGQHASGPPLDLSGPGLFGVLIGISVEARKYFSGKLFPFFGREVECLLQDRLTASSHMPILLGTIRQGGEAALLFLLVNPGVQGRGMPTWALGFSD